MDTTDSEYMNVLLQSFSFCSFKQHKTNTDDTVQVIATQVTYFLIHVTADCSTSHMCKSLF